MIISKGWIIDNQLTYVRIDLKGIYAEFLLTLLT